MGKECGAVPRRARFKAPRLLFHSVLGSRVIIEKRKQGAFSVLGIDGRRLSGFEGRDKRHQHPVRGHVLGVRVNGQQGVDFMFRGSHIESLITEFMEIYHTDRYFLVILK